LAAQFVSHGHDVKWLCRTIMSTAAYQQPHGYAHVPAERPEAGPAPARLRPDPLLAALQTALDLRLPPRLAQGLGPGLRRGAQPRLHDAFGYDPCTRGDELAGSIPQALLLMNAPLLEQAIGSRNPRGLLARMLSSYADDRTLIGELYLRCLSREPSDEELRACLQHVRRLPARGEAYEDLLWALVNSSEFLYRR
jgi:hypothetical protein